MGATQARNRWIRTWWLEIASLPVPNQSNYYIVPMLFARDIPQPSSGAHGHQPVNLTIGSSNGISCSFFVNLLCLYSTCRRKPDMAINGRRNKPFGPGGSTRRLHPSPAQFNAPRTGLRRGRTRIDEGVKDGLLLGMVPPLSGQTIVANDNYAPVAQAA